MFGVDVPMLLVVVGLVFVVVVAPANRAHETNANFVSQPDSSVYFFSLFFLFVPLLVRWPEFVSSSAFGTAVVAAIVKFDKVGHDYNRDRATEWEGAQAVAVRGKRRTWIGAAAEGIGETREWGGEPKAKHLVSCGPDGCGWIATMLAARGTVSWILNELELNSLAQLGQTMRQPAVCPRRPAVWLAEPHQLSHPLKEALPRAVALVSPIVVLLARLQRPVEPCVHASSALKKFAGPLIATRRNRTFRQPPMLRQPANFLTARTQRPELAKTKKFGITTLVHRRTRATLTLLPLLLPLVAPHHSFAFNCSFGTNSLLGVVVGYWCCLSFWWAPRRTSILKSKEKMPRDGNTCFSCCNINWCSCLFFAHGVMKIVCSINAVKTLCYNLSCYRIMVALKSRTAHSEPLSVGSHRRLAPVCAPSHTVPHRMSR